MIYRPERLGGAIGFGHLDDLPRGGDCGIVIDGGDIEAGAVRTYGDIGVMIARQPPRR